MALSHGPEPREGAEGKSTAAREPGTRSGRTHQKKKEKEKRQPQKRKGASERGRVGARGFFLFETNVFYGSDMILKAAKSCRLCTQQPPPDRQLLMLTHACVI